MSADVFLQELATELIRREELDADVLKVMLEEIVSATDPVKAAPSAELKLDTIAMRRAGTR